MMTTRFEAPAFGDPIVPVDRALPDPSGTEVVVEVSHCGVCHTDLHVHEGGYDLGGGKRMSFADRGVAPPLVLGHEIVGRAVAAGPDAAWPGDGPAVIYPWIGCGSCFRCADGDEHLCARSAFLGVFRPGGYARHVVVPHPRYLVPLDGLDPGVAAPFACSGLTAFGAVRKIGPPRDGAAVAVVGCGGLGLTAIALLTQMGHDRIVAIEPDAAKRAAAADLGAAVTLDPGALDAAGLAEAAGAPILAALDFVGSEPTAGLALGAMAKGGTLVIVGLFGGELRYPLPYFPARAIGVVGSYVGGLGDLRAYVDHVRRNGVPPVPITHRPMAQVDATLRDLGAGRIVGRAVLVNDAASDG